MDATRIAQQQIDEAAMPAGFAQPTVVVNSERKVIGVGRVDTGNEAWDGILSEPARKDILAVIGISVGPFQEPAATLTREETRRIRDGLTAILGE